MYRYCIACGKPLEPGSAFCPFCNTPVAEESAQRVVGTAQYGSVGQREARPAASESGVSVGTRLKAKFSKQVQQKPAVDLDDAVTIISGKRAPGDLDDALTVVGGRPGVAGQTQDDALDVSPSQGKHASRAADQSGLACASYEDDDDATPTIVGVSKRKCYLVRAENGDRHLLTPPCVLGRGSNVGCRIRGNKKISREQARIFKEDGTCFIRDLASVNGTQVNGSLLGEHEERAIHDGDVLVFGEEEFTFVVE